jgi:hypothetical protein
MIYNYCTLFDSGYLSRGLLMYNTLMKYSKNAFLYVFAFDYICYNTLIKMNLPKMKVISLAEFEDPKLLRVKPTRSRAEYCWTASSSTILYILENFKVSNCTYVDADIIFYSDPSILIKEMGGKSVLLTEHNYTKDYDQSSLSGRYCVQFMTFKKTIEGLRALRWWRERCLEWCYNKREDGKFGDQKYLDDWPSRFKGVYVSKNIGAGIAPWNVQQYEIIEENNCLKIIKKSTNEKGKIIFFHYHQMKFIDKNKLDLGGYKLDKNVVNKIYNPLIMELKEMNELLRSKGIKNPEPVVKRTFKDYIKLFVRKVQKRSNIYKLQK